MYNPQLDTFVCVAEAGSFSKAAEKMFITAPAVIKQINSLENSLGLQLFYRTHRGLSLTESGKSLYKDAQYIIKYCKESVTRARNAMSGEENIIRVGVSLMTSPKIFVDLWPQIQKIIPDIKFQLATFENTPENAKEILANLGQNIDVVSGIFDDTMLKLRKCNGIELSREPFCIAVPRNHRLSDKKMLELSDIHGEKLMLIKRGWSNYADMIRDELWKEHPEIEIEDFDFYNVDVFNKCENENILLLAVKSWENVHPLMKIIPVNWSYGIPFGLLCANEPSDKVKRLLDAVKQVTKK